MANEINSRKPRNYDDIIDMPHHVSPNRIPMGRVERAAQFSPFAALVGHSDAIKETARLVDEKEELTEEMKSILDEKLRLWQMKKGEASDVVVTYFVPDEKKAGGMYMEQEFKLKKVDIYKGIIVSEKGDEIRLENIFSIEGDIFNALGDC